MRKISGILFDYDGTLVDSARKNMQVCIEVLKHFDPQIEEHLPDALMSYDKYQKANHETQNWKELYVKAYGVDPAHLAEAAALWGPEQEKNERVPDMFEGMIELIRELKPIPLGICSQNNRVQIENTLKHYGVRDCFDGIIGTLEVPITKQKPDAEGFLRCLEKMGAKEQDGVYIYIGDHSDDVTFGKNAAAVLRCEVVCVAIDHAGLNAERYKKWEIRPDYYAENTKQLKQILDSLIK